MTYILLFDTITNSIEQQTPKTLNYNLNLVHKGSHSALLSRKLVLNGAAISNRTVHLVLYRYYFNNRKKTCHEVPFTHGSSFV